MSQKILIIGMGSEGTTELMLQSIREKYGNDVELVTPEQAKERGLTYQDFANIPSYSITAPTPIEGYASLGVPPSGKENRRNRRAKERKSKKKRN